MFADADHEVIDSSEALFRHLYEEHGVTEARDLDPETAPVQFWLRRHAELERAERSAPGQPDPPPPAADPEPRPRAEPRPQPAPARGPGRDGRRPAGFGDPLVEAMARALAGRGYDEAAVRSAIRSFSADGRQPGGEAAVRAVFVEPMLQSAAERLLGAGGSRPPDGRPQPAPTTAAAARTHPPPPTPADPDPVPPPPPQRGEEPVRPEAAWAVLWADLADPGRRQGEAGGPAGDEGDDLMAVANAVQTRRRVRLLRR